MKRLLLSKGIIIALSVVVISLFSYILYNSYATNTGITTGNNGAYTVLLTDSSNTVTVPAKSSKTIYYQFNNTNKGTVKYHIGYTSDTVVAKTWWDSKDPVSGTAAYGEYKFVKLKLINDTTSSDTITIKSVLGFENGGNVIPDSNTTLITGTIAETNTMSTMPTSALNTLSINKTAVEEVYFVNDNIVPASALGSTNMNNDGTIKLWYEDSATQDMYKVYIGSDNGITSFPSNSNQLFNSFSKLTLIDFSYVNTSNVTSTGGMFAGCTSLEELDLSGWDTSNVRYMTVTNSTLGGMFTGCTNLETLNLSGWDTSSVLDMYYMFANCKKLVSLDIDDWDTSKVTRMANMFENCNSLESLNLGNWNTSSATGMNRMFYNCNSLVYLNIRNFNTTNVNDMSQMFYTCSHLITLDLSSFNTSNVRSMAAMFYSCSQLKSIDLSNFNTSSVESMANMFEACSSLLRLDLSHFNTANVTNMQEMFKGCSSLISLDVSNFNTEKVTKMNSGGSWQGMFNGCSNLQTLDLSSFDTSLITNMAYMFYNCRNLQTLIISDFTTDSVTNSTSMFGFCDNLTTIDMRKADLSNISTYNSMFNRVPTTSTIYLKDTQGNRDFMSTNFSSLTGVQYIPSV